MSTDALQFIVNSTASTLVACAAVWWFLFRRELEPASELTLDVHFAGRQDNQILLEVIATLANKSPVQQRYESFQVKVRYLRVSDKVIDGPEGLNYQLLFSKHNRHTN
ncbi:hypothetical protein [Variovorax saccharolyticus]|uniref:hypothetical protein n=1 Tax=Variovorax saccharolyticus TaxID=3053516 RepID=UPI002577D39F|nr:hypothetical protein [Variovorax sp. J31P216]MDM0030120.1 hypothetical protein [Variovorax sp. J31P216]